MNSPAGNKELNKHTLQDKICNSTNILSSNRPQNDNLSCSIYSQFFSNDKQSKEVNVHQTEGKEQIWADVGEWNHLHTQVNQMNPLDISEELLLNQNLLISKKGLKSSSVCRFHFKNQDIICMVDGIRICSHCALFGAHKDHTFKAESELLKEITAQQLRLKDLQYSQKYLYGTSFQENWKQLEEECKLKEKDLLDQLNSEFLRLLTKIEAAKREIQISITEQTQNVLTSIKENQIILKKQAEKFRLAQWTEQGLAVLKNLRENFESSQFDTCYRAYDRFGWLDGQLILGEEKQGVQRIKQQTRKAIQDMKLNLNLNAFSNITSTLFLASQINFNSEVDTSITSLDDLHKHIGGLKAEANQKKIVQNQFLDLREFAKFRNSECLETIHQPARSSIGYIHKSQRTSAKCFKKINGSSKKENKPFSPTFSSNLIFQKLNIKMQTSILPLSKSTIKSVNSPRGRARPDPMFVISEYERTEQQFYLNLSECNLSQNSLVYFLERANKVRLPLEVNLEKNNLSTGSITRLVPYLINCSKINLSFCGLGESCLQTLLRTKALKKLEQINLTGNEISSKKNKTKIDELKRMGIRVICG